MGGAMGCIHIPLGTPGPLYEPCHGGGWDRDLAWAVFLPQFHCCGSNNSQDWRDSEWIRSGQAGGRVVPDSCCKTVVPGCGQRDHASNIYKVEVGWWMPGVPGKGRGARGPGCWGLVWSHLEGGRAAAVGGVARIASLQCPDPYSARVAASPSWRPSSRNT